MKIINILLKIIFLLNLSWAMGLETLTIPQKANVIAMSGAGIAGDVDLSINPASIALVRPYLGFSSNTWYAGLSGHKSTWIFGGKVNKSISFESLGLDDIEYHINNNVEPQGYISANWFAIDFGSNINLERLFTDSKNFNLGYNIKFNYSKLHTESFWGYTLDLGLTKKISDKFSLGFVIKNLGKQFSKTKSTTSELYLGTGSAYTIDIGNIDLNIYLDWINYKDNDIFKLGLKTGFPYINLMVGSSYSNDVYSDFSYGLSFEIKNWMLIFGNLNHENPVLGSPKCIELRKYF